MSEFCAPRGKLTWFAPPASGDGVPQVDCEALAALLKPGALEQVYTMGRRSVYRATLPDRRVAVKEVCYHGLLRQFKRRHLRESKVVHEFRCGCAFVARGGVTPRPLGLALEQDLLFLKRGFIFIEWLENAVTLAEYLKQNGNALSQSFWRELAESLLCSARLGFVHGGHSSDNILVVTGEESPARKFQVIDFADAVLHDELCEEGYLRDVARIGVRMTKEKLIDGSQLQDYVEAVVATSWPGCAGSGEFQVRIYACMDKIMRR